MNRISIALIAIIALMAFGCATHKAVKQENKPGMVTTASGLKYIDLIEGNGPSPITGHTIVCHYVGTLENGNVFDSSIKSGKPFSFRFGTGEVIKGWDEGIAGMKTGGKRKLVIPPALGYGNRSMGKIPANSTLIFEIELLEVK